MYWISHAYATFYTRWATHASFTDKINTPMAFSLRFWMVVDVAATVATSGRLENSTVSNGSSGQTTWSHNRSLLNIARIFNLPHQVVTSRFQFVGVREAKSPVACHVVDVLDLPPSFDYHVLVVFNLQWVDGWFSDWICCVQLRTWVWSEDGGFFDLCSMKPFSTGFFLVWAWTALLVILVSSSFDAGLSSFVDHVYRRLRALPQVTAPISDASWSRFFPVEVGVILST